MAIDPLTEIEALVACKGRWAGTAVERRAAEHLGARLRSLGREAELEPAVVRPDYPLTYVLHILLALAGGALSARRPKLGAAALVLAIVSAFGDSSACFHLLRRLTKRAVTHNVLARDHSDGKRGTVILLAHYDAAKTGRLFDPKALERRVRLGRRLGIDIGLFEPFTWSLLALLTLALLRTAGARGKALTAAQIPPMLVLAAHIPLLLEIRASDPVPGAADNASGVATVLRLAERHGGRLRHFDLWVLLTGAEEGLTLGIREWLRTHERELDPRRTIFLNIEEAGYGTVRYATTAGHAFASPDAPTLSELCDEVRDQDPDARAQAMPALGLADAGVAAQRGYSAIRIACLPQPTFAPEYHQPTDTPDRLEPAALERAFEFCSQLIERIDTRLGATRPPAEAAETARVREIQDRTARHYDRQIPVFEHLLFGDGRRWVAAQAEGSVLELAIGTARNLPFYPKDVSVTGIELSPEMLVVGRRRAHELGSPVDLRLGDAQTLDFADESFDTVVCTLGLCTIPDPRRAVAEARRVLRPEGRMLLLEHVRSPSRPIRLIQRLLEPLAVRFAADHLTREPLDYLREQGFEIERVERSKWGIVERVSARKPIN